MSISLPPKKQVLVLGARGRLGYACVQAFAQANWQVLAHVRTGSSLLNQRTAPDAQVCWVDTALDDPEQLGPMLETFGPVHVVINAMAPNFSVTEWKRKLATLDQLAIGVAKASNALLIQPLSVLGFGSQLKCVLYEGETVSHNITPEICAVRSYTERRMQDAAQTGVRVCSLRIGTLYGHGGWGWISAAVAKNVQKGRFDWLGPYDVSTPWAYAPDVACTMERIACHANMLTGYTNLHFAGQQRTGTQWVAAAEATCHKNQWLPADKSLRAGKIHWVLWKPAALFSSVIHALAQMQYIWRTPHRLDNSKLCALIGAEPSTDWQVSVDKTLELLNHHDDLHGGLIRTHLGV